MSPFLMWDYIGLRLNANEEANAQDGFSRTKDEYMPRKVCQGENFRDPSSIHIAFANILKTRHKKVGLTCLVNAYQNKCKSETYWHLPVLWMSINPCSHPIEQSPRFERASVGRHSSLGPWSHRPPNCHWNAPSQCVHCTRPLFTEVVQLSLDRHYLQILSEFRVLLLLSSDGSCWW